MKIKDVITETNLTDRAIRLYIENGLVSPSCSESYTGRRNFEFSQEDIENLKNIATLRKAGFSIQQIKTILSDSSATADIVRDIITDLSEKIKSNTAVLDSLKTVLENENISVDTVCSALNNVTADKDLPAEDAQPSLINKIMRIASPVLGMLFIIFNLPALIRFFAPELRDWTEYLYPCYNSFAVIYLLIPIIPIVLSLHFVFAYNNKKVLNKKAKKLKTIVCVVLCILLLVSSFFSNIISSAIHFYGDESFVVSQTTDIDDYMFFDDKKAETTLAEFLPETLPESTSIEYSYYYKDPKISHEPPQTIVHLEIWLNDADYEELVKQYKTFRPADSTSEPESQNFASWSIIFYREDYEYAPSNYTPVFAYNDFYKCVRFICHYGQTYMKGAPRKESLVSSYQW